LRRRLVEGEGQVVARVVAVVVIVEVEVTVEVMFWVMVIMWVVVWPGSTMKMDSVSVWTEGGGVDVVVEMMLVMRDVIVWPGAVEVIVCVRLLQAIGFERAVGVMVGRVRVAV
jgi:hypothetical protein